MASIPFIAQLLKTFTVLCLLFLLLNSSCKADNVLYPGETLNSENSLQYGSYILRMQEDCNLVLYDNGNALWASGTHNRARSCHCTMQRDGNLVIYTPEGRAIWASNTARGQGFYVLVLQKDRNLVIYGTAIWATGTNAYNLNSGVPAITVVNEGNANLTTPTEGGVAAT